MPSFSQRGIRMPESPIRKLFPLAHKAKEEGVTVYTLNIGQPDIPTPPEALEAIHKVDRKVLEYSPSDGLASLRVKMSEYYRRLGIDVKPDQVTVTTGGSEAVLFSFLACLDPGDEVIVPEPAYANYVAFLDIAGAHIIGVPSCIEDGFRLPPIEEIERRITPRTKAIMICNPNNPTGYIYSREELEQIRDIVRRHDLFLFSDEVYREFCYNGTRPVSVLQLEGIDEQTILIDSVSKRYNECGIRIGALVTRNRKLRDVVMKFCQARLSPPLLGQIVAEASIDAPQSYLDAAFAEYKLRRDVLIKGLNEIPGVLSPMPQGAFYTVARLPVDNAEDFCRWCLTDFRHKGATIFMAPAAGFYTTPGHGEREVRIAYVLNVDALKAALEVLRAALEAYPGRIRI